jgi:hypothetical protein
MVLRVLPLIRARLFSASMGAATFFSAALLSAQTIDLPSSKQLIGEAPGHPQRINSLPISMAVSPMDATW